MKKRFLEILLILTMTALPTMAFAVCEKLDGNCLDQALRSLDRIDNNTLGPGLEEDVTNAVTFYTAVGVFRQSFLTQQTSASLLRKLAADEGTKEVAEAYTSAASMIAKNLCIPQTVSPRQSRQIVRNYLNTHPDQWADNIDYLLRQAFTNAFPCQKQQ
jgi:Rap1a immunity proteins